VNKDVPPGQDNGDPPKKRRGKKVEKKGREFGFFCLLAALNLRVP